MKLFTKVRLMLLAMLLGTSFGVKAVGWPANYEGVMLQGFYWDSYSETSWANLTAQADELSKYFKLIWVPNSAKAEGSPSMGYHPIYWFTNHNSSFGTEAQLRNMISTFKAKGTGFIADVVINHRSGVSNWTNFPTETWNGKTYSIGLDGICRDDEVRNQSGQGTPTGNYDTGEGWDGSRDLDHTNANVQANIKDYIKCLLTDFGYSGVRYDFVKGYGSQYTKMYNQANNVQFSVGEYWDGSYDAVKAWIDGTGKESAAFDFPFKYQLNKAFNGGSNYGELVWKAYGTTDQPAGMIHADYQQYAVTFIDNHDTYRDGSKYTGDVLVANAFMLSSPGTPCVFYPHYKQYKSQIQAMIAARNGAGVTNTSKVNVLESGSCYVAEVQGTKGKLWVKLGNSSKTPGSGYTKKASGNGYEIWTTTAGGTGDVGGGDTGGNTGGSVPASLYVIGEVNSQTWDPSTGTAMTKTGNKFYKDVTVDGYFSFAISLAADWDALNVYGNRYAPSADTELTLNGSSALTVAPDDAKAWYCTPGDYALIVDFDAMTVTLSPKGTVPQGGNTGGGNTGGGNTGGGSAPGSFYVIGEVNSQSWDPSVGTAMTKTGNKFYKDVTVDGYFSFAVSLAADWDALNVSGNRYAPSVDTELTLNGSSALTVAPDDAKAWYCTPGDYALIVDFDAMTVTLAPKGTVPQGGGNTGGGNDNPGGGNTGGGSAPGSFYVIGEVNSQSWDPSVGTAMTKTGNKFYKDVTVDGYFSFAVSLAADWDALNVSGNRYAPSVDTELTLNGSSALTVAPDDAKAWYCTPGEYALIVDFDAMTVTLAPKGTVPQGGNTGGGNDNPGGGTGGGSVEMPAALYLVGNFPGCQWDPNLPIAMEKGTSGFLARNVDLVEGYNGNGYWSFLTVKAALPADYNNTENPFDWDGPQGGNSGDRYGSAAPDTPLSLGGSSPMVRYEAGVNASAAQSWMTPIGKYDIVADFKTMTVKLVAAGTGSLPNEGSAVEAIESDFDGEPEYYNLQGVRVYEPSQGIYIVRRGNKVTKEVVR